MKHTFEVYLYSLPNAAVITIPVLFWIISDMCYSLERIKLRFYTFQLKRKYVSESRWHLHRLLIQTHLVHWQCISCSSLPVTFLSTTKKKNTTSLFTIHWNFDWVRAISFFFNSSRHTDTFPATFYHQLDYCVTSFQVALWPGYLFYFLVYSLSRHNFHVSPPKYFNIL